MDELISKINNQTTYDELLLLLENFMRDTTKISLGYNDHRRYVIGEDYIISILYYGDSGNTDIVFAIKDRCLCCRKLFTHNPLFYIFKNGLDKIKNNLLANSRFLTHWRRTRNRTSVWC